MWRWLRDYRYRRAMRQFRESMAFLGTPIADMTDEDLISGASGVARLCCHAGITVAEAADAMTTLARSVPPET